MKENYFKQIHLLAVTLGHEPSLVWRSSCSSIDLLKEGLLWRVVGNGEKFKITGKKWVPIQYTCKIQPPVRVLDTKCKNCELINVETSCWKDEIIVEIFSTQEAEVILSIPISRHGAKDKMIWNYIYKR